MSAALELELLGVPVRLMADEAEVLERLGVCYALAGRKDDRGGAEDAEEHRGAPGVLEGRVEHAGPGYRVAVGGRAPRAEPDAVAAVRALNHELLQALMERCRAHYFVHAAVVVHGGRALVLPGLSRAGKSTLALALVLAGAGYLSDELLCYTSAGRAEPLPRALKIRDECVACFPELAWRFVGEGEGRFLPFAALRADVLASPAPVGAIVVPRWDPRATDRPAPILRGEALLALAASSLNFGAHRELSLDWLAELVDEARTLALPWRDPRAAAEKLLAELG